MEQPPANAPETLHMLQRVPRRPTPVHVFQRPPLVSPPAPGKDCQTQSSKIDRWRKSHVRSPLALCDLAPDEVADLRLRESRSPAPSLRFVRPPPNQRTVPAQAYTTSRTPQDRLLSDASWETWIEATIERRLLDKLRRSRRLEKGDMELNAGREMSLWAILSERRRRWRVNTIGPVVSDLRMPPQAVVHHARTGSDPMAGSHRGRGRNIGHRKALTSIADLRIGGHAAERKARSVEAESQDGRAEISGQVERSVTTASETLHRRSAQETPSSSPPLRRCESSSGQSQTRDKVRVRVLLMVQSSSISLIS